MRFALLLLPMALCLTGCYTTIYAPGATGRVLDADTGRPVRHARVIRAMIKSEDTASTGATNDSPQFGGEPDLQPRRWPPEDSPAAMVVTDERGEFNLPPDARTAIAFLYLHNATGTAGSFVITADGYGTNRMSGIASSKTLWRVELGKVLLKKQEERTPTIQEELAAIKAKWKSGVGSYKRDPKLFVTLRVTFLKNLLNYTSEGAIQYEIDRICATNVAVFEANYDKLDECYDTVLLETLVARSIDRKDRPQLLALLTRNFPGTLEQLVPLEFYCAKEWSPSILVLFDAYEQTKSKGVKERLLLHLGHAFCTLRNQNADDTAFLKAAREWFTENSTRLQVNNEYPYLAARMVGPVEFPKDLFLLVPR